MPPTPWATYSFRRRKDGNWGRVSGWYGHVEVPENAHWDPGALRWSVLLENAKARLPRPAPTPRPVPTPPPAPKVPEVDVKDGAYIYVRDKDGSERWERLTKTGAAKRWLQWQAGKFQELRFKRA